MDIHRLAMLNRGDWCNRFTANRCFWSEFMKASSIWLHVTVIHQVAGQVLGFGDHTSIDLGAAIIKGSDYRKIVGGGSVGGAAGDHRAVGQIEGYFVLNGAVGGLLELVEGANDFEILNDLVALGLDHAASVPFHLTIGIVWVAGDVVLVDHGTRIDGGTVGHGAKLALGFRVENTVLE